MRRERLDKLMVDRGLAPSRERARALILAGKVEVAGQVSAKAGAMIDLAATISLREADHPYVSRGALKLEKGLDTFGVDPSGKVALDIGASTGGFTDLLLRRGAARVFAIDVGYGQLAWSLRNDPRVVVMERTNVRSLDPAAVDVTADLAVIDVSFISLTLVLGPIARLMGPPGDKPIIALVKPQFEAGREHVGKGGVVRDPAAREAAVEKVRAWARAHGFGVGDVVESPITGPAGNVEFLLMLTTPREWVAAGPAGQDRDGGGHDGGGVEDSGSSGDRDGRGDRDGSRGVEDSGDRGDRDGSRDDRDGRGDRDGSRDDDGSGNRDGRGDRDGSRDDDGSGNRDGRGDRDGSADRHSSDDHAGREQAGGLAG